MTIFSNAKYGRWASMSYHMLLASYKVSNLDLCWSQKSYAEKSRY